jgi:hypothetical protein
MAWAVLPSVAMLRRRIAIVLTATALTALAACASGCATDTTDDGAASTDDGTSALSADWTIVGAGVAYKRAGSGPGVFIGYGGYSVKDTWACAWTSELYRARLEALGVGHLYCVRGPRDVSYAGREIGNSKLAAHLVAGPAADAPFILVAAHSSGHYVAAELFGQLFAGSADPDGRTRGKIVYADLDGGQSGLDDRIVGAMKHAAFVWAEDSALAAGRSANASVMESAGARLGQLVVRVRGDRSGCHSGARFCLHDLVITTRPHNPATFDLEHDYSDFDGRAVQTQWVDAVAPLLAD